MVIKPTIWKFKGTRECIEVISLIIFKILKTTIGTYKMIVMCSKYNLTCILFFIFPYCM
ncbi:Uncharacterised protein [Klebsiella quasipneumoniae]|nr:Uncharacterised protein [Klebsiella quasipneumoniae]